MADQMVKVAGLYENTSQRTGKKYFTGYMGAAKVLIFEARNPEEGGPTWDLFIAERGERRPATTDVQVPAEADQAFS